MVGWQKRSITQISSSPTTPLWNQRPNGGGSSRRSTPVIYLAATATAITHEPRHGGCMGREIKRVALDFDGKRTLDQVCAIANLNAPGQTVIAGNRTAVERAIEAASQRGARRALMLPVSAPFHSPLMKPVRETFGPLLDATVFSNPKVPVVSNVDAQDVRTGEAARSALIRQVDAPVRWVESVRHIYAVHGATHYAEVGPGKVLSGLMRRIEKGVARLKLDEPESLVESCKMLVGGNAN